MTCSFARTDVATALLVLLSACSAADSARQDRDRPPEPIAVTPAVNACPTIASYFVLPQRLRPDEFAAVLVQGTDIDSDDDALSYAWSATSGVFSEPAQPFTEYRCAGTGPQVLTVTASDEQGCGEVLALDVDCAVE
jgi:hypothetical protein